MTWYGVFTITFLTFSIVMLLYQMVDWTWLNPFNRKRGIVFGSEEAKRVHEGQKAQAESKLREFLKETVSEKMFGGEVSEAQDARIRELVEHCVQNEVNKKITLFRRELVESLVPRAFVTQTELENIVEAISEKEILPGKDIEIPPGSIRYEYKEGAQAPMAMSIDSRRAGMPLQGISAKVDTYMEDQRRVQSELKLWDDLGGI